MCPEPASAKFVFPCLFKQTSRVRYRFPCRLFAKCPIIFSSTRTICYMVRRETQRCCFKVFFPRGHFTTSHLPGSQVSAPKFSLCLPVPFTRLLFLKQRSASHCKCKCREKAARAGVSAQLASFLLYSLSPFHPNPDILENKDLLTELTKQYKVRRMVFTECKTSKTGVGGAQEPSRPATPSSFCGSNLFGGFHHHTILEHLISCHKTSHTGTKSPSCLIVQVIRACQLASRQILRGQDCCSMFFKKFRYQPEGKKVKVMFRISNHLQECALRAPLLPGTRVQPSPWVRKFRLDSQ